MMMFIGQISIGRLLRLGGAGIIGVLMLVGFIRFAPDKVIDLMPDRVHTWKARIERFSDPADAVKFEPGRAVSIDGDDYQVVHAKIALARGGLFGKVPRTWAATRLSAAGLLGLYLCHYYRRDGNHRGCLCPAPVYHLACQGGDDCS